MKTNNRFSKSQSVKKFKDQKAKIFWLRHEARLLGKRTIFEDLSEIRTTGRPKITFLSIIPVSVLHVRLLID